jgi:hypothetical protein
VTPEQEILQDLLRQVDESAAGLDETLTLIEPFPSDLTAFTAMSGIRRVASLALLKQVEQLEGGLAGAFRAVLRNLGVSTKGMFPYDADAWVEAVKLRNALVHEYPRDEALRFERLRQAHDLVALLRDAAARLVDAVRSRGLLP